MKLTIQQDLSTQEDEIIIKCSYVDTRMQKLIDYIRQYTFSIKAQRDGKVYQIPIDEILYIESVDNTSFLYTEEHSYSCEDSLTNLENSLRYTPVIRISKSCLMNTSYLKCVAPYPNHRLNAELNNGEHLIVSRNYIDLLKAKIDK